MKKKIFELKQTRAQKIEAMQGLYDSAESEKRSLTDDEKGQFDGYESEIKELDAEISRLETLEKRNQQTALASETPDGLSETDKRDIKRFDLFKAIREMQEGNLTGVEKELHEEAAKEFRDAGVNLTGFGLPSIAYKADQAEKRAGLTVANNESELIEKEIDGLHIIKTPTVTGRLGVRVLTDLHGKLSGRYHGQTNASFVDEGDEVGEPELNPDKWSIEPRRIGASKMFSKEYFAQRSKKVHEDFLQDFYDAIYRGVDKDFISTLVNTSALVLSGYGIADTAAVPGLKEFIELEMALETESMTTLGYLTTRGMMGALKRTPKDSGSGIMVWEKGEVNGYKAIGSNLVPSSLGTGEDQHAVIFGNWRDAIIGQWGAMEIIVDPYAGKKKGEIEVTINGLFDSAIQNPDSFRTILNAIPTE